MRPRPDTDNVTPAFHPLWVFAFGEPDGLTITRRVATTVQRTLKVGVTAKVPDESVGQFRLRVQPEIRFKVRVE